MVQCSQAVVAGASMQPGDARFQPGNGNQAYPLIAETCRAAQQDDDAIVFLGVVAAVAKTVNSGRDKLEAAERRCRCGGDGHAERSRPSGS